MNFVGDTNTLSPFQAPYYGRLQTVLKQLPARPEVGRDPALKCRLGHASSLLSRPGLTSTSLSCQFPTPENSRVGSVPFEPLTPPVSGQRPFLAQPHLWATQVVCFQARQDSERSISFAGPHLPARTAGGSAKCWQGRRACRQALLVFMHVR